ncbi:MAG: PBP1A family penicillin-binding protein [Armatimonadota bacterium]
MKVSWLRTYSVILRYVNVVVLAGCFASIGLVAGGLLAVREKLPDAAELTAYRPKLTTEIYSTETDPEGNVSHTLLGRIFKENRKPVSLTEVPLQLRQATIAIEDRPFYSHRGIDPKGILRAAWVNFKRRGVHQGGSTITQQLVRNIWLARERTFDRKLKEAILAIEIERKYSKDEMLEMYFNEVYYGHGAYGVRTAARLFFDKNVADLTLAECALLAGLTRAPSIYSPYRHPERAKERRRQVLHAMVETRSITPEEAADADAVPIEDNLAPLKEHGITSFRAPYFTHLIVHQLTEKYGWEAVYEGGLKVYTTIDMRLQKVAEEQLTEQVKQLRSQGRIKPYPVGQGALAAVEVKTGNVLAMVGGVGPYEEVQFNRAYPNGSPYGRQPGSSFKPYVWASALQHGYSPNSVFSGSPISIKIGRKYWRPKNYTPGQGGNYTLRRALAQSVNLVSVRLVKKLGVETVRKEAAAMLGLPVERLRPVMAIALGVSELAPLEQAAGYITFASGGYQTDPRFITHIEDYNGDKILTTTTRQRRVIEQSVAISMISMQRTVVESGTGTRARIPGYKICGKTGTTQDGRDAWWVGFSPDVSCAVWVGNDDYKPMRRASGGYFCAPVFREVMKRAIDLRGYDGDFPEGAGVKATKRSEPEEQKVITICAESGGLATPYCPSTVEKKIRRDENPPPRCSIHGPDTLQPSRQSETDATSEGRDRSGSEPEGGSSGTVSVTVCTESGRPAGPYCPSTMEKTFPSGKAPTGQCTLHGPPEPAGGGDTPGDKPESGEQPADAQPPAADQPDQPDRPDTPGAPEPGPTEQPPAPQPEPEPQPSPAPEPAGDTTEQ